MHTYARAHIHTIYARTHRHACAWSIYDATKATCMNTVDVLGSYLCHYRFISLNVERRVCERTFLPWARSLSLYYGWGYGRSTNSRNRLTFSYCFLFIQVVSWCDINDNGVWSAGSPNVLVILVITTAKHPTVSYICGWNLASKHHKATLWAFDPSFI